MRVDALLDLAERLDAAADIPSAWTEIVAALAREGVAWCHHAYVAPPASADERPAGLLRLTTLPEAWRALHLARGYWRADAAVRHCAKAHLPLPTGIGFALAAGDAPWIAMCREAEAHGFGDGLAIPLRGAPGAAYGGFSLVTPERGARFLAWRAAHGGAATLIAQLGALRLVALAAADAPPPPRLSPRERECLVWLAAGLRSDRIAERLGLARATVDLHLARARRRLGARTREQAVARAIWLGLLGP